jgi:hypothetical protein
VQSDPITTQGPSSIPAPRVPHGLADLELFTRAEAASVLKLKESWLRDNQKLLNLPHLKMGALVRYSRDNITAIQEICSPAPAPVSAPVTLTPIPKKRRSQATG